MVFAEVKESLFLQSSNNNPNIDTYPAGEGNY